MNRYSILSQKSRSSESEHLPQISFPLGERNLRSYLVANIEIELGVDFNDTIDSTVDLHDDMYALLFDGDGKIAAAIKRGVYFWLKEKHRSLKYLTLMAM